MSTKKSSKILRTKQEIMAYIDVKSEELFNYFVERGLPVIVIGRQWYAHTENLDEYFRHITRKGQGMVPAEAE